MVTEPIFKPGQTCGGTYDVVRFLRGNGAFETYLAIHRATRDPTYLTCSTFQHLDGDPPAPEYFTQAIDRRKRLVIDGLPRTFGGGVGEGVYWLAEQHVSAPTAADAIRRVHVKDGSIEWRVLDAIAAVVSIAFLLSDAAEKGIHHGSLSPECILIDRLPNDFAPVLLGLGHAQLFLLNARFARMDPRLRAPEQLTDGTIDARSDIYALGMVLYSLLAGVLPFSDREPLNHGELLALAERATPRPLSEICFCPDALWSVLLKMIAKDPRNRFQTIDAALNGLDNASERVLADPRIAAVLRKEQNRLRDAGVGKPASRKVVVGHTDANRAPRTVPPGPDTRQRVAIALARFRASAAEQPTRNAQPSKSRSDRGPALPRDIGTLDASARGLPSPSPGTPAPIAQRPGPNPSVLGSTAAISTRTPGSMVEGGEPHDTDRDPTNLGALEGLNDEPAPVTLPSAAPPPTIAANPAPEPERGGPRSPRSEANLEGREDAPSVATGPNLPISPHPRAGLWQHPRVILAVSVVLFSGSLMCAAFTSRQLPRLRALAGGAHLALMPHPRLDAIAPAPVEPITAPAARVTLPIHSSGVSAPPRPAVRAPSVTATGRSGPSRSPMPRQSSAPPIPPAVGDDPCSSLLHCAKEP